MAGPSNTGLSCERSSSPCGARQLQSIVRRSLRCPTRRASIWRGIGESRVLAPTDSPGAIPSGHDQKLPASNDSIGRALISSQRAVEPHNGGIGADEGQFLQTFALHAIPEDGLVDSGVTFLDRRSSTPDLARPQNPSPILLEHACEGVHVMAVPCLFPLLDDGRNLLPVSDSVAGW